MNIILILLDTLRADYLGCYGNSWIRTPYIDKLASESFVFDEAYAEGCPTVQARRALWTGRRTFPFADHKIFPGDILNVQPGWRPLHDEDVCLSEMLLRSGYVTSLITDTPQMNKPSMNFQRGFFTYEYIHGQSADHFHTGYTLPGERKACPSYPERMKQISGRSRKTAATLRNGEFDCMAPRVFSAATRWLEDNYGLEKFFLLIDSFDPHEPWDPPLYYRDIYSKEDLMERPYELVSPNGKKVKEEQILDVRGGHAGEITMTDRWIGWFLESVELMGLMHNTLICLLSDHGAMIGDHGMIHKGPDGLFRGVVRIPVMIRHPEGTGAGKRTQELVYNMDLVPTILEYAEVKPHERVEATSLVPLINGTENRGRDYVTSGYDSHVYYHDATWDYGEHRRHGPHHLYNWKEDPEERRNLVEEKPELVKDIKKKILEEAGPTPIFDPEPWPPQKDFYERYGLTWY